MVFGLTGLILETFVSFPLAKIRPATLKDYAQICDLFEDLDSYHRQGKPDLFNRQKAPPRERAYFSGLIDDSRSTILVAPEGNSARLLGFAILMIRELPASSVCLARQFVEIDKLGVREQARRAGVGRAILLHSFDWAAQRGLDVELSVHEFNTNAIGFYEAMGFSTVVRRMVRKLPT